MSLSSSDFWSITPREFWMRYKGWEIQKKEDLEGPIYYHRYFTTTLYNLLRGKGQKPIKDPKDLIRLSSEAVKEIKEIPDIIDIKTELEKWSKRVQKQKDKPRRTVNRSEAQTE